MAINDAFNTVINTSAIARSALSNVQNINDIAGKFGLDFLPKTPKTAQTVPGGGAAGIVPDTGIQPISAFIAAVKHNGLAKTNHFAVTIIPPEIALNSNQDKVRLMNLLCSSVHLPGVNIATTPQRTFGETFEMPSDKNYSPLQTTFYVDRQMYVKGLFDQWIELIQNPRSRTHSFYRDYAKELKVTVFDSAGFPQYEMTLQDAYPKTIDDIQLSHDSVGIMHLNVTWAYRTYVTKLLDSSLNETSLSFGWLSPTAPTVSIQDRLMGYIGDFKSYQSKFNNISGTISRAGDMVKSSDIGGLAGISLTSF